MRPESLKGAERAARKERSQTGPLPSPRIHRQHCIEQLKTETACATILSNLNSADAKVNAFYSKTELIAAASCSKAVPVEPSDCPVSMFDKEVYFMWGEGGTTSNYERPKTSVYVGKGLPAASRLDRLMNFFTEFFAAA